MWKATSVLTPVWLARGTDSVTSWNNPSSIVTARPPVTVKVTAVILSRSVALPSLPGIRRFLLHVHFHAFPQGPCWSLQESFLPELEPCRRPGPRLASRRRSIHVAETRTGLRAPGLSFTRRGVLGPHPSTPASRGRKCLIATGGGAFNRPAGVPN